MSTTDGATRWYVGVGSSVVASNSPHLCCRAVTYNGTTGATVIYHDGASVSSGNTSTKPSTTADPIRLFRQGPLVGAYDGQCAGIALYSRILTLAEIQAWQAGTYDYTGCDFHYKMDEQSGTTLNDSSPNARHATASGTTSGIWKELPFELAVAKPSHPMIQQVIG